MRVIIIGGGAAGIMAAVKAKQLNPDYTVTILEKQNRIGRKLLSTGNGRCNLTNTAASANNYNGTFNVDAVLKLCPPQRVIDEFCEMGLEVYSDECGRVYPISNHAGSVLDVLRFRLEALGVEVITNCTVKNIKKQNNGFSVATNDNTYSCDKVIFSTGSCASPKLGADSSGIKLLKNAGVKITPLSPALCPVKIDGVNLSALKGIRAKCRAGLFDGNRLIKEESGEIQFTENALSGICIFNLSSKIKDCVSPIIKIDLLPDCGFAQVESIIEKNSVLFSERTLEDLFTGVFQKRLGAFILKSASVAPLSRKCASLKSSEIKALVNAVKKMSFKAVENSDFSNAQVVSGGVSGDELDSSTMECRRIKGLYIIGEAVDADGECGGFNLQFAFAGGIIAGENV